MPLFLNLVSIEIIANTFKNSDFLFNRIQPKEQQFLLQYFGGYKNAVGRKSITLTKLICKIETFFSFNLHSI